MRPDAEGAPAGAPTKSAYQAARHPDVTTTVGQSGLDWLAAELQAIEEKLAAARLTIAARGIIPRPAVRSATIALVALDAAISDLEVMRAMPDATWLDTGRFDRSVEVES